MNKAPAAAPCRDSPTELPTTEHGVYASELHREISRAWEEFAVPVGVRAFAAHGHCPPWPSGDDIGSGTARVPARSPGAGCRGGTSPAPAFGVAVPGQEALRHRPLAALDRWRRPSRTERSRLGPAVIDPILTA